MEEEEITYARVVFKNSNAPPQETKEENTAIYSTLKHEGKEPVSTVAKEGEAATHSRLFLSGLGILCVLLVASIAVLAYIMVTMKEQQANLDDLAAENERISVENRILMNQTKQLSRERDDLNRTLKVILTFDNFPVKDYCPGRKCQPCRKDWILYKQKCYLFYDKTHWMTWERSQKHCQNMAADLVVIEDLQEQEFISNHSKSYYDKYHGYWLGLREINKNWLWIDGRNDTLGYWIRGVAKREDPFTLMIPQRKPTESWNRAQNWFLNRFICEAEVLI